MWYESNLRLLKVVRVWYSISIPDLIPIMGIRAIIFPKNFVAYCSCSWVCSNGNMVFYYVAYLSGTLLWVWKWGTNICVSPLCQFSRIIIDSEREIVIVARLREPRDSNVGILENKPTLLTISRLWRYCGPSNYRFNFLLYWYAPWVFF